MERSGDAINPRADPLRYVLVPIGAARLDDDEDEVYLDARATTIAGLPAYRRGDESRECEHKC